MPDSRIIQRGPSQPSTGLSRWSRSPGTGGRHQSVRALSFKLKLIAVFKANSGRRLAEPAEAYCYRRHCSRSADWHCGRKIIGILFY